MRLPSPLGALAVGGERLNETAWRGALDEFVARLFAEVLLTMPQKRIVLNVEDAALPRALRRALADAKEAFYRELDHYTVNDLARGATLPLLAVPAKPEPPHPTTERTDHP